MNDDLVEHLDKAVVAHALWKAKLQSALNGKGEELDRKSAGDEHACAFGKWLDSQRQILAQHPEFHTIYEKHAQFHGQIGQSLDQIGSGRGHEVERSLKSDGSLRLRSNRLVLELLRWRDRLAGDA